MVLTVATLAGGAGLVAATFGVLILLGVVGRKAAWETCEIALWRSDGDGEFRACAVGREGKDRLAATSPMFRLPRDDMLPRDRVFLAAHNVLVQRLAWEGWQLQGSRDAAWWKGRYRRPVKAADE